MPGRPLPSLSLTYKMEMMLYLLVWLRGFHEVMSVKCQVHGVGTECGQLSILGGLELLLELRTF